MFSISTPLTLSTDKRIILIRWTDSQNIIYTFSDTGRVHGTFEPGSRDHDWVKTGHSDDIQRRWQYIEAGWSYSAQANVDISLGSLIDAVKSALGIVAAVIAIV